ncbi:hypothetical protein BDN71DRAFT_1433853 [Pleurotus eryngii]|uniref:Uncharacterized protein n=1 Tax=Pleurotus eryngii TaxID=5323 RepID=A0A9P6DC93_PLEER|nr:hypothetical protein BDN71DRAFT_1433853 [Pleurotus eryngii]
MSLVATHGHSECTRAVSHVIQALISNPWDYGVLDDSAPRWQERNPDSNEIRVGRHKQYDGGPHSPESTSCQIRRPTSRHPVTRIMDEISRMCERTFATSLTNGDKLLARGAAYVADNPRLWPEAKSAVRGLMKVSEYGTSTLGAAANARWHRLRHEGVIDKLVMDPRVASALSGRCEREGKSGAKVREHRSPKRRMRERRAPDEVKGPLASTTKRRGARHG